ncbi:proteasome subunit alpha [Actinopolymorpha singaporensis]|uniref:Proteasome subunit alpha n=1 Tax=Actinopolymorpha singaporensis TaxID=117157 RepID=A0A1H1WQL1_9ACTN|nr:proteasome subunit alpha [Actinopolymorpha singaporensis]SDS98921.1 proteasome alpha subunit [Actinopolymorpha singaporensis]
MTMPFYVSPEQQMKDRADFARKNISRGRGVAVLQYDNGIVLVAENRSPALHKISEIYDRIAFAAVGRYNEFENLRVAGVRSADMRGYSYDRRDVTARGLANFYAQVLGTIFSSVAEKPYEVELFVAEVGETAEQDQIYRLTYDGSVADERGFAAMGGSAEQINAFLERRYQPGRSLSAALALAVEALGQDGNGTRRLDANQLEVAVLDRTRIQKRKFRRLVGPALERLLTAGESAAPGSAAGQSTDAAPGGAPGETTDSPPGGTSGDTPPGDQPGGPV